MLTKTRIRAHTLEKNLRSHLAESILRKDSEGHIPIFGLGGEGILQKARPEVGSHAG